MKKLLIITSLSLGVALTSCKKADFADNYADPSKISVTSVEKQYAGFLKSNSTFVLPDYWNYFVVLRTTTTRYTQAVGFTNSDKQYIPGEAGISGYWNAYYALLAQYREMQKVYSTLSPADQAEKRIFFITATIYLYDFTQKMVDLHGSIPFSKAGNLSTNGGNYLASLASYDDAATIYTKMLDDLKAFSDELSTMTISTLAQTSLTNQDYINKGSKAKWQAYCNSLRLRILTRVSGVATMKARVATEIDAILKDAVKYPVVADNAGNIQINVTDLGSALNSRGFRTGLEDWGGNIASKAMIDHMNTNADPRLRAVFEPGDSAKGVYMGINQLDPISKQDSMAGVSRLAAYYNRSTLSRNEFFPGVLINAAEVSFMIAEYHANAGSAADAKTAYEKGIQQSIDFYYNVRKISNNSIAPALTPYTSAEVTAYLAAPGIDFSLATTKDAQVALIANQKWLHFNVVQSLDNWAELRRLKSPSLVFQSDANSEQKLPPVRWIYPSSESVYNTANYNTIKANDNLNTKLFWDVK
jgi:hypothetical protein